MFGVKEVEDALQRLDKLTQEEVLMAAAETLTIARGIDDKVNDVDERLESVDERVQSVDVKVEGIDGKVLSVDDKVQSINNKVQGVDDKLLSVDKTVQNVDDNVLSVDSKVQDVDHKVGSVIESESCHVSWQWFPNLFSTLCLVRCKGNWSSDSTSG